MAKALQSDGWIIHVSDASPSLAPSDWRAGMSHTNRDVPFALFITPRKPVFTKISISLSFGV
jgi:hypothetical protein